jgi:hypothetical protein
LNVVACLLRLFLWFYVCGTGTNEHAVEHIFDGSDSSGSLIFGGIAAALIAVEYLESSMKRFVFSRKEAD